MDLHARVNIQADGRAPEFLRTSHFVDVSKKAMLIERVMYLNDNSLPGINAE